MKINSDYLCCPKCEEKVDAALTTDGKNIVPKKGDFSVCLYCSSINKFNGEEEDELHLIEVSKEELDKIMEDDLDLWLTLKQAQFTTTLINRDESSK